MTVAYDQLDSRVRRGELFAAGIVIVVAVALRMAHPSRFAIEHFDEGVYASNLWFGVDEGYQYPQRHLYAPPLLPWLLEWSIVVWGPSGIGPMLVSALGGIATAVLVWWVARNWFGPPAGLAAATLAAGSDFHLLYSRTALTDVLLCFWILGAIALFHRAVAVRSLTAAVLAGVVTGAAWWTKYNGWLPLAIALGGLIAWVVTERMPRREVVRGLSAWAVMLAVALAVWGPVWAGLQSYGGYAAVAANHRRYVTGVEHWWENLVRQVANHWFLDGWLSCLAVGGAAVGAFVIASVVDGRRFTWNRTGLAALGGSVLTAGAAAGGSGLLLAGLSIAGLVLTYRESRRSERGQEPNLHRRLAVWLLVAWLGGLLAATPFYRPYPRLTLPGLVAVWLGAGAAIGMMATYADRAWHLDAELASPRSRRKIAVLGTLIVLAAAGIGLSAARLTERGVPGWQSRSDLERISGEVVLDAAAEARRLGYAPGELVIYTYAEPAIFYHLRAAGLDLVGPISNLDFVTPGASQIPYPTFLVVGPHALRSPAFRDQWEQVSGSFERVASYDYQASDFVLLNEYPPRRLRFDRPVEMIQLYRWKSSATPSKSR